MLHRTMLGFALAGSLVAACSPDQSSSEPGGNTAQVRVAHLSPDAPAVDFCLAPHGTSDFTGPVLASAGAPTGIAYGQVTKYLTVGADAYDVRLVAPGAADCTTPLGGLADFDDLPALPDGGAVTIAAEGLVAFGAATPLTLAAYVDDTTVDASHAALRFIHASPGTPAVDVGTGGGVLFTPVFGDISYGAAAAAANGYVTTAPLSGVEISARVHGSQSDALSIDPAVLPAGAIATAFAIGEVGDQTTPLRVLLCTDNAPPTGVLSSCALVGAPPQRAHVRVAHLSPDLKAVDLCVATAGTTAFSGPVLAALGAQDGLTYAAVTTYVDLPAGKYDVRVILATAAGCSLGAIPTRSASASTMARPSPSPRSVTSTPAARPRTIRRCTSRGSPTSRPCRAATSTCASSTRRRARRRSTSVSARASSSSRCSPTSRSATSDQPRHRRARLRADLARDHDDLGAHRGLEQRRARAPRRHAAERRHPHRLRDRQQDRRERPSAAGAGVR